MMIKIVGRSRRPPVLVVAVCFLLLILSHNTKYTAAISSWRSTTSTSTSTSISTPTKNVDLSYPSPMPGTRIVMSISRCGSLEESSKSGEEDGDVDEIEGDSEKLKTTDNASVTDVTSEENGGGVDLETAATESSEEDLDGNVVDNDDQEEEENSADESSSSSLTEIATALRLEGKEYHDQGDFIKAAEVFQKAADTLLNGDDRDDDNTESSKLRMSEDYATCRLHQALCHLKSENYELCIDACTDVLQDDSDDGNSGSTHLLPAINARAYHRRAKAKMALGDNSGALQDARTASFLGDGKAVNLYGKLMRESSSSDVSSIMNPLMSSPESSSSSSMHSALLESLMNKSSGNGSGGSPGGFPDFSPASLLMGSGGGSNMLGALGSGGGGMAKSVVKNLVNRLDDETTQVTICNFLQQTNKAQLVSLASMAGVDNALQDSQLDKLVGFCHGITPKGIRRTVRGTKVVVYFVKVIRRTIKVINKYKSLIVLALVLQWTKSALMRPLPINTKAIKKAAKLAAKEALKEAMETSRAGFF